LRHELELVELYLGIQRTRFRDRLTTQIRLAPDTLDCAVPSLVLQPLVENAIQHGIGRNIGEDSIEIESRLEGDRLCLEVRNRNSVLERISGGLHRRGIGLSNSRLRLKEIYGDAAEIHLIALTPRGACCRVRVPIRRIDIDDLVRPAEEVA
jgi:LytS/YehU family sensor histidine kinase